MDGCGVDGLHYTPAMRMMEKGKIVIRAPRLEDGAAIAALVRASGALDVNSTYLYFLLADHFSATCAIAYEGEGPVGFVTAYRLPQDAASLFVWQVTVDPAFRGRKVALSLLLDLSGRDWFRDIKRIQCTIAPGNASSRGLFRKWAEHLSGSMREETYLTASHLGQGHEAEPLVTIDLPS